MFDSCDARYSSLNRRPGFKRTAHVVRGSCCSHGSTGSCATGWSEVQEVLADTVAVLIAASVMFRTDSSTLAVLTQNGIVNAATRLNHFPRRTGPRVASNPGAGAA